MFHGRSAAFKPSVYATAFKHVEPLYNYMLKELMLHYHSTGMEGAMGVWGWLALVLMTALWIALLILVVAAAYWVVKKATQEDEVDDAEAILRERYARGEIDEDEYLERKNNL